MHPTYEHHFEIRKNKSSPFKYAEGRITGADVYNWHENIEVLYVTEGEGIFRYGTEDLSARAGDLFIINREAFHQVKSETEIAYSYLIIDEHFCLENGIKTDALSFVRKLRDRETEALFLAVGEAFLLPKELPTAIAHRRAAVLALLIRLCEAHVEGSEAKREERSPAEEYVKRTVAYLAEHYAEPQSLETLAALSGVTRHYLARVFKQYTGETIFSHLIRVRLRHAEAALRSGVSVTEAALAAGFESLPYFSRVYKKHLGVPPSSKKRLNG